MLRSFVLALTVLLGASVWLHHTRWLELAAARGIGSWDLPALGALVYLGFALGAWLAGLACSRLPEHLDVAHVRARGLVWVGGVIATGAVYAAFLPTTITAIHWAVADWGRAFEGALLSLALFPASVLLGAPLPWIAQALARSPSRPGAAFGRVLAALLGGIAFSVPMLELSEGGGLFGSVWWVSLLLLAVAAGFAALGLVGDWRTQGEEAVREGPTLRMGTWSTAVATVVYAYVVSVLFAVFARVQVSALSNGPLAEGTLTVVLALGLAAGSGLLGRADRNTRAQLPVALFAVAWLLLVLDRFGDDAAYWAHWLRVVFSSEAASYVPYHVAIGLVLSVLLAPVLMPLGAMAAWLLASLEREDWAAGRRVAAVAAWIALGAAVARVFGDPLVIPVLGLHRTLVGLASVIAIAGALCLWWRAGAPRRVGLALATALCVTGALAPTWDLGRLMLGLSSQRRPLPESFAGPDRFFATNTPAETRPLRYATEDLRNSVAVVQVSENRRSLVVDGGVLGMLPQDDRALTMLALVPAWLAGSPERALVLGANTQRVARLLGAIDSLAVVEVAESSRGIRDAVRAFEDLLPVRAEHGPIRLRSADPRRRLQDSPERYDLIIATPEPLWSRRGVRLVDHEALEHAAAHLRPGGVFAMSMPRWGGDAVLLRRLLMTFRMSFDATALWQLRRSQWLLVGFRKPEGDARPGPPPMEELARRFRIDAIRKPLWRADVRSLAALVSHEVLPVGVMGRIRLAPPLRVTDQPRVRRRAARAFFSGTMAEAPAASPRAAAEVGRMSSLRQRYIRWRGAALTPRERRESLDALCALDGLRCAAAVAAWRREQGDIREVRDAWAQARYDGHLNAVPFERVNALVIPAQNAGHDADYDEAVEALALFRRADSPVTPLDPALLEALWSRCAEEDARCAAQWPTVEALGAAWGGASELR